MKNNHKIPLITKIIISFSLLALLLSCSGCELLQSRVHELNGSIAGNPYNIDMFDNSGNLAMSCSGEHIKIAPNIITEYNYSSDGGWVRSKTLSSVITITIDGNQLINCGDTCIFYDKSLKPDYDFTVKRIDANSDKISDKPFIAETVNNIKNAFGKPMIVLIRSQLGDPIYAFSGDKVYWEVPENLPKFTKLMVDDKAIYIHRANFQIIDTELLES